MFLDYIWYTTPEQKAKSARWLRQVSSVMPLVMAIAFSIDFMEMYRQEFATEVSGKIIGSEKNQRGGETPIYEYVSLDGKVHRSKGIFYTHPLIYEVGETVDVLYWDSDPESGTIKGWGFIESGSLGLMGLLMWIIFRIQADWLEYWSKQP